MSILTDELPVSVAVGNETCNINTDFKIWLKVSELLTTCKDMKTISPELFTLVFPTLPPNYILGLKAIMEFFVYSPKKTESAERHSKKRYFDFEYDAELIYSAFLQQYSIDLCDTSLHWWKFKALLGGLSEETHFAKVIGFRSMNISSIKDPEQKAYYMKMKKMYALPDNRSVEQQEQDLNDAISGIF